ncbi:hypothetical protein BGZ90_008730, partial [Linnemannia elongata]
MWLQNLTLLLALLTIASTSPIPNLIGDNLGVINLASQNQAINNGHTAGAASHSSSTQNVAQQN